MLDLRAPGVGRLTADGKALYFAWNVTGVAQVWKSDGPRRFPIQLTGGEDATQIVAILEGGKWLVISRDRKGEENPGLYLQATDGGPLVEIQHKAGVQTQFNLASEDGRSVYFSSNDIKKDSYAIYRFDVAARTRETLFEQEGLWAAVDLRSDGRLLLRKATGGLWHEFYDYDPAAKRLAPLFGQGEKEEFSAAWGAKPGEVVVLTNKFGEFRRLYSFTAGKFTPISDEINHDLGALQIDRRRTRVLHTLNEGGYTRLRALDARTYKPIALPPLPDADHVFAGPMTPDGRFVTLGVDDGRHPLQAFVLDWKTRKLVSWHLPSTPEIDTLRFARAAIEAYPARDGAKVPVLVRTPAGLDCTKEPCRVVIDFHGGPEGQSIPGFNVFAQSFVDAGFIHVQPNVRGSDGYGKSWLHADDGPKRLEVITDIEDAAKWARTRFAVAGKAPRVGIVGGSYGGYSVLIGMTMFAGAYDAGVDIVGISNLVTFLKNTAPYRRILRASEYGDLDRDAVALAKLSPTTYVDRVRAPLLIIQGATDPRVPAGEAIQIHEALQKRGIASRLIIFPDEGHGAQKRENRALMLGHSLTFFEQYLK
ncbi:MAG: S9 family peptidase [Myxococcales bacterium]|nr:S9 family peptidase [Myxococcales bacterium]